MSLAEAEDYAILRDAFSSVLDVMTKEPVTLAASGSVQDAITLFAERRFRHVPVIDGGRLVGVLSDRDVLRFLSRERPNLETTVAAIMTKSPLTVREDTVLSDAIGLLVHRRINCLPVVSPDGHLSGIITSTDLLRALHAIQKLLERGIDRSSSR